MRIKATIRKAFEDAFASFPEGVGLVAVEDTLAPMFALIVAVHPRAPRATRSHHCVWHFHAISGADIIDKFGYRECPRR